MTLEQARAALCDLLIGRSLRMRAETMFRAALALERYINSSAAQQLLEEAAHIEWIAGKAERGLIHWGGRFYRHLPA